MKRTTRPMTPQAFADRCREIVSTMRGHEAHRALDFLTNDVLREQGFGEGIDIFEAAVARWHLEAEPYPYPLSCPDCDSDGTAPAAACEDMPVPDRTAKRGPKASPMINRSNPHG